MKNTCVKFFVALLLFALPVAAFAQNTFKVTGKVYDAQDYIRVCLIHENVSSVVSSSSGISCSEPLVHSAPAIPATWHKLLLPAAD